MKKTLFFFSSFALLLALPCAGESTNRLHFPAAGFTIAPLDAPPGESPQQALAMFLPASDGFAANVNVQIQPYTGTIEGYITLTSQQFKSAGIKVLQEKTLTKSVALFEYTGKAQGQPLHWYARAEKSGDAVFLVTATATPQQWSKESARLKACVDSFRCGDGEQNLAPKTAGSRP
jgi:hypothetical protein